MKLARVVGTVVSTINVPVFDDRKLLVCDLVSPDGMATDGYLIAVDTVGAGAGETVLLMDEGNSARQVLDSPDGPVRTIVVGIVDHVEAPMADQGSSAAGKRATTRGAGRTQRAKAGDGAPSGGAASGAGRKPSRRTRNSRRR